MLRCAQNVPVDLSREHREPRRRAALALLEHAPRLRDLVRVRRFAYGPPGDVVLDPVRRARCPVSELPSVKTAHRYTTHRLVEGYFHVRPLGPLALKGKAEPIQTWQVISARPPRTRLDVEAERGLTPFVGRPRQLRLLQERFERAKAGEGQVVFLVGEPGIGKSRLLYEFRRELGAEATWLEGRCISLGRSIPLHPVIDLVRRNFNIEEGDSESAIVGKVERGLRRLGDDLRSRAPYVRFLLSVDPGDPAVLAMDPQQRRAEIFDSLRQLWVRAADGRPLVVAVRAKNNNIFVPLAANNVFPDCLSGCVAVFARL
jgi:AAA ATPase domain